MSVASKSAKQPAAGIPPREFVVVVSTREGFRRAGRAWSCTPTRVARDELSEEAFAALRAEPLLVVTTVSEAIADGDTGAAA